MPQALSNNHESTRFSIYTGYYPFVPDREEKTMQLERGDFSDTLGTVQSFPEVKNVWLKHVKRLQVERYLLWIIVGIGEGKIYNRFWAAVTCKC